MKARHAAAGIAVVSVLVAGCGSGRSPERFCAVMDKHKDRYLTAMSAAANSLESETTGGTLAGIGGGLVAIGDLQVMWEELADVAPEEISPDVERIRDENAKQLEAAGDSLNNPLGALGRSLMGGFMTAGSYQRVDEYTRQHCNQLDDRAETTNE